MSRRRWLDTETKALLHGSDPAVLVGVAVGEYSLVLLETTRDRDRLFRAAKRVLDSGDEQARRVLGRTLPIVVASGLSVEDALLGQFEFICCDAKAVFLRDEVAHTATRGYLNRLYTRLSESDEFALVFVEVRAVPDDREGRRYVDQFLGSPAHALPVRASVPRKKARIMQHWATKIGADVADPVARA